MRSAVKLLCDHLLPALAVGMSCAYYYDDWTLLGVALLTGWMIDSDHLVDFAYYLCHQQSNCVVWPMLTSGNYFKLNDKVIVPLHSWELAAVWGVYWIIIGNTGVAVSGALAWIAHLLQDQLSYRVVPLGYFISFRASRRFALAGFCRE